MNTLIKKFKQEPDEFEIIYRYPEKENIDGPFVQSVNIDDYIRSIRGEDYIEPKIESDVKPKLEPGINLNEESIESVPTKSTQSPIKEKVHTRYECYKCHLSVSSLENLKIHRCFIELQCDVCAKKFTDKQKLYSHKKWHTRSAIKQRHECNLCKKTFTAISSLNSHIANVHDGQRPFECKICKKRCAKKVDLKKHELSHTGEKPHQHQKTHSSQRLYECAECGQKFKTSGALRRHVKCHSGEKLFKCDLCSSKFLRSDSLKDHRKRHTADRQFGCDLCSKRFFDNKGLQRHKLSHTKEKPYKCQFCKKKFSAQFCCILHTRGKHFDLLRQQDKLSGTLNVLFQVLVERKSDINSRGK
ncbi:endothelial zinc finger protein induced by tumor necrosis factor alpha-like [Contarinia nasturtii]|uniref:endothelial zinc finger protein induced by tumor necrosis factor alpha-like n=1 Tax=Contarinia nasturtii TaxID=265458 RepID=UPI0012D47B6B|nr:endothelial zinc finger protein induced by tumor necrosis factor alpha-like [Contarinia nasturtii]